MRRKTQQQDLKTFKPPNSNPEREKAVSQPLIWTYIFRALWNLPSLPSALLSLFVPSFSPPHSRLLIAASCHVRPSSVQWILQWLKEAHSAHTFVVDVV